MSWESLFFINFLHCAKIEHGDEGSNLKKLNNFGTKSEELEVRDFIDKEKGSFEGW